MSRRERFRRSATPFLCGVYGGVSSLVIPLKEQKSEKAFEVYSPLLSVRRARTVWPVRFSTDRTKC